MRRSGFVGSSGLMGRSRVGLARHRKPAVVLVLALSAAALATVTMPGPPAHAAEDRPPSSAVADPAALVHPLDGTGTGPVTPGTVGEFPGADLPFGMIQWSPDTSPNAVQSGGGYAYSDHAINGFSLTHLSGTGCPSFQDVPVLPTVGAVGPDPETATDAFSHHHEQASAGRYQVSLGPGPISAALSVTARTGIARFTFPTSPQSNLLFKVAGSVNPVTASSVQMVGRDELVGQVTSGQFCGTGTNYTLHFVALFDRPFSAAGTWTSSGVAPNASSCNGTTCGTYVTFDTSAEREVLMKVGISFVSTADANENLRAEDPGWSLANVSTRARDAWNAPAGARRRVGRHAGAAAHLLHRPLPLAALPQRRVRRERRLPGQRRKGSHRPRRRRVRRLLRVGHLPERDPARVAGRAPAGREHGPVPRRRRGARRVVAQMGHRRRGRVADERRLGRPDHCRRLCHGRAQLRRRDRPPPHGEGRDRERDGPRFADRAAVSQPVPRPALRQRERRWT